MTLKNSMITREQVQRNEDLQPMYNARYLGGYDVRNIYEAARTKDRALIQSLVDALADPQSKGAAALDEAKEQGFTPTEG
jgi:hypothetical protein